MPGWVIFVMPVLLAASGLAWVAKLAYPVAVAGTAFQLGRREPPAFLAFVLWIVVLTPGLRHFVDWYAGFSQTNPMMLAPYLAIYAAAPTVLLYIMRGQRHAAAALILLGAVIAGLAMPIVTGAITDALLEAVRWAAPICLAVYVLAHADSAEAMIESVTATLKLALPAAALYGLVQFVAVLPWDAYYMKEAPITSIGVPEPFLVRVFGTMNSPGTLAAMLASGTLLLLPRVRGWHWVGILLALTTLLLTSQRAAIGAFAVSFLLLTAISRAGALRANLLKLMLGLAVVLTLLLSVPEAGQKVLGTFNSVDHLEDDDSARLRLEQYRELPGWLDDRLYGRGLGWSANPFYIGVGDHIALDSGIIDIFVSLGVPVGLLYLTTLGMLVLQAAQAAAEPDPRLKALLAAAVFGVIQLPFGGQHTAEQGVFLYLALGLLLARSARAPARSPILAAAGHG